MKHIVIAGGGFAGVRLARKLRKQKDVRVTLINSTPDFRYCPALYRAATGYKMGVARLSLEWMLLDASNVNFIADTIVDLDAKHKKVSLLNGEDMPYDIIVFALGAVTTYFNIDGLHEHAVGVKTVKEVLDLREHLHEKIANDTAKQTNYVVVGAGPTGVEMAAALGGYVKRIAKKHDKPDHNVTVWLVEGSDRVLPNNSKKVSRIVRRRLESLGVKVLTNTFVEGESVHELKTSTATIKTHTVVWTAGTAQNPFYKNQDEHFRFDKRGRVIVSEHLEALPNIYVIGDNAATDHSGLAQTAIMHANYVAKDIHRKLARKKRKGHKDVQPIQIVPVGKNWAILQYGPFSVHGPLVMMVRKFADYIGYADVLGFLRALTIWSHSDVEEDNCTICHTK